MNEPEHTNIGDVTKWLTASADYNMIAMVEFNFAPEAIYERAWATFLPQRTMQGL
jgi:hypothetical protein